MKRQIIKLFSIMLVMGLVCDTAFASPQPTPVNVHIQRSPMDKLSIRLRQQSIQISRDEKAGKLTKAQAKALKGQVEAIRKAEIADLKANGTKTLTDALMVQKFRRGHAALL